MTSNDAFFVRRPPCFLLHFFTDECIGAPSPDLLNIAQLGTLTKQRVDNTMRMRMFVGHDETKYLSHNSCANVRPYITRSLTDICKTVKLIYNNRLAL